MKLSGQLQGYIKDAWAEQSASSCYWAIGQLNQCAFAVLEHQNIEIENYSEKVNSLQSLLIWKKQTPGVSEIPILRSHANLVDIVNSMIDTFKIHAIKLKARDLNNGYYFQLIGTRGGFDISVKGISNCSFPCEKISVIDLRIIHVNSYHHKFTYQTKTENQGKPDELKNEEIEFSELVEII